MTPQERWWALRANLPTLTRWQKIGAVSGTALLMLLFVIIVLPFLLPLSGETISAAQLADPNGAFITLHDTNIYYVHDPAPGETVILVHGFWGATIAWREVMPALQAAGYNVYALDLAGFGLSEKGLKLDVSHPFQAELIMAFMEAQQIDSAHFVGHSMGANVVMYLAMTQPERVKTLTLVDAAVQTSATGAAPPGLIENAIFKRWGQVLLRWIIPPSVEIQLRSATRHDEVVDAALIDDYLRAFKTEDWELSWLALARDSARNTLPESLQSLDLPVLILWGENDSWIAPENAEWLAEDIPGATLITFPETGHLPMHEVPADFNRNLLEFLEEHP